MLCCLMWNPIHIIVYSLIAYYFVFNHIITHLTEEIQAAEAEARRQGQGPGTDDAEGWIQGLITRIASNVSVSLLDLSITFSEV